MGAVLAHSDFRFEDLKDRTLRSAPGAAARPAEHAQLLATLACRSGHRCARPIHRAAGQTRSAASPPWARWSRVRRHRRPLAALGRGCFLPTAPSRPPWLRRQKSRETASRKETGGSMCPGTGSRTRKLTLMGLPDDGSGKNQDFAASNPTNPTMNSRFSYPAT